MRRYPPGSLTYICNIGYSISWLPASVGARSLRCFAIRSLGIRRFSQHSKKILRLHKAKQNLADAVLEGTSSSHAITLDELRELLK